MIFITTGTTSFPFKRLIDTSLSFFSSTPDRPVTIQTGHYQPSYPIPHHITIKPFISFSQTIKYYQKSQLVISAAGEASLISILTHTQYKPIFFPRLKKFNEQVDDQQLVTAQYIKKHQLAHVFFNSQDLTQNLPQILDHHFPNSHQRQFTSGQLKNLLKKLNQLSS